MKKKNAFTLIELIAVLVILAIIAVIVTPLVLNIVKKAKGSADKRSVDAYGKAIEVAIAEYLVDTGKNPKSIDDLDIKYTGNEVICETRELNKNRKIFLTGCTVQGRDVTDPNTEDGYYHYGQQKVYKIGDKVTYNGIDFYVIADSDKSKDSVTLLKAEPLTVDEVNKYGAGHINKYTYSNQGTAKDYNGYGGMAYYTSETCGVVDGSRVEDGCTNDYNTSEIKYAVDAWTKGELDINDLIEDSLGYKSRLITFEELTTNFGYIYYEVGTSSGYFKSDDTPTWVYNYFYWTMSSNNDSTSDVLEVSNGGGRPDYSTLESSNVFFIGLVRPVINIKKYAIE